MYSRSKDETGGDEVFPWSGIEKLSSENQQCVEPTTSLVDTLRDEIGRVSVLVALDVLKGVVIGSVWHAARSVPGSNVDNPPSRLEPAVKDLLDPLQLTLALLGGDGNVVNRFSVQILDAGNTGKLLELSDRADANDLTSVLYCWQE